MLLCEGKKDFTLFCIIPQEVSKCNELLTKIETIEFSPVSVKKKMGNLYQFTFTSTEKKLKDSLSKPYMLKYEFPVITISASVYMCHNMLTIFKH